ncbi:segregation and condensation protein A [Streptomyces indiaensis]|uniref:Segregation and condensation protein A n=1 Tax=Streptomyces indiaensis TaxID=284033 RepID=A0ABP5RDT6_9ACTN|nr:segregation/condensation protein A [Streptomyces indiaensis]
MTSNASPPPAGGPAGRRRALGRGPGAPRTAPPAEGQEAGPREVERQEVQPREVQPSPSVEEAGPAAAWPLTEEAEPPGPPAARDGTAQPVQEPPETVPYGASPVSAAVASALPAGPVAEPSHPPRTAGPEASPADPVNDRAAPGAVPGSQPPAGDVESADDGVFKVRLANFEGPFDLLLQLISRHKLDVTEVALSKVTDEFMAHIRAMGPDWDLDETTEFLVVAATLLDLKAARLLPAAEVEDEGDLALLEARDLLFARLLQYRAYKQIADIFSGRLDDEARRYPRTVGLEAHHAELLPDVVISIGAEGFAKLAVKAMQPRPKPQVYVDHIHAPLVSVQEQAQIVVARLRELGEAGFRDLVADTDDTLTIVARFLALLELYREKAVALEQERALGDLLVRWTGGDGDETPTVTDEFDRPPEPPKEEKKA